MSGVIEALEILLWSWHFSHVDCIYLIAFRGEIFLETCSLLILQENGASLGMVFSWEQFKFCFPER